MDLTTIPWSRIDPGNALARDYLVAPESVLPLFARDYRDPRALRAFAAAQRTSPREPLAPLLLPYNREVGGSAENAARIDEALCVVAGQQVGLLFGPAYTTWKLFTTIRAAKVLSEELATPVVPVFWVESEDHDWDEVNRFHWGERRFRIEAEMPAGTPLSLAEADPGPFLALVREAIGRDGEAWDLVAPERRIARWHVRNLARLVAGEGVVFVEPALLREPMRALARRIAADPSPLDASLSRDTGRARSLAPPDGAYFFRAGPPRTRLDRGEPLPVEWSSDVASRVLVQNAAFRALAAVCGPSEIAYWSQLREAHEAYGIPMPAVLPRNAATLVESGIARDAARVGLDVEEVVRGDATAAPPAAEDPVALRLRRLAGEAASLTAALDDGTLSLPPNTENPFRRTVERLGGDLARLAARLDDAREEARGAGRRREERVLRELRPRGGPQERSHGILPYLLRHGPGLAKRLRDSFDPWEFGHYLVFL